MAPKGGGGKGGGGGSHKSSGGSSSSSSSCSSGAFSGALPIAVIVINSITLIIFLYALYAWPKARKASPVVKSLLAWWTYGLAVLMSIMYVLFVFRDLKRD